MLARRQGGGEAGERGVGAHGVRGLGGVIQMGSRAVTSRRGSKEGAGWRMGGLGGLCVCAAVLLLLVPGAAAQLANVRLTANVRPMAEAATPAGASATDGDAAGINGRGSLSSGLQAQVPTVLSVLEQSREPLKAHSPAFLTWMEKFDKAGGSLNQHSTDVDSLPPPPPSPPCVCMSLGGY